MPNASLGPRKGHLATGALEVTTTAQHPSALQDDLVLSRPVEALLTDVVIRLRESWVAGPAKCWGGIHPISELAVTDGDKRVAAAFCEGFSNFSQFLCGLEVLMLQRVDGSAEFEQTLLGIEQLFVHGPDYVHRLGLVPDGQRTLSEIDGAIDSGDCTADEGKVHGNHLRLEESCARGPGAAPPVDLGAELDATVTAAVGRILQKRRFPTSPGSLQELAGASSLRSTSLPSVRESDPG